MKVTVDNITPELVYNSLREMCVESPTAQQVVYGKKIARLLNQETGIDAVSEIVEYVMEHTKSCDGSRICFCQVHKIFAIAFVSGVKMANALEDVEQLKELERLV